MTSDVARDTIEAERLGALRALEIVGTTPDPQFDAVCSLAQTFFKVPTVLISLIEEDRQWFKARCGFEPESTRRDVSFCDHVIQSDEIFVVEDALLDARFATNPLVTHAPLIRFYAGAPLVLAPGIRVGTICVIDVVARQFSAEDCRRLDEFATIVVALLRLQDANVRQRTALTAGSSREALMHTQTAALARRDGELREANRLLLLAEEMAKAGHWRRECSNGRSIWSPEVYRIFGVDPHTNVPDIETVYAAYHPEDRDRVRAMVSAAIAGRMSFSYEARICRPDGSIRHVDVRGISEFGGGLESLCLFGVIIDISDRKLAEIARRETEERLKSSEYLYRTLADSLPQMVWIVRAGDRTALYGNDRYQTYYGAIGTSRDERISSNHPDDVGHMEATWKIAADTGRTFEVEGRLRRHDGVYRWHKVIATPVRNDGKIVNWLGTALDIDDLVIGRQKLKETSDLLSLAQGAAGAGFFDLDFVAETVTMCRESALMHGLDPDDLVDIELDRWKACVDPDDGARILALVDEACRNHTTYSGEFRILHDGVPARWILGNGRAQYDQAGRAIRMIGLNFDVTERKASEAKLIEAIAAAETARQDAEQASAAKSDFLASMSHEIRTPLNSIIGYTDILLEEPHQDGNRRKLELIRDSGSALLTIVSDILDFSKIEAGEIDLDPVAFSPSALIDNVLSIVSGLASATRLKIECELPGDLPGSVYGDAGRLRQILLNLLNNAIKFTSDGTVKLVVVRERSLRDSCRLRFIVMDTGIGIPADRRERLFQRFSQVDGSIARRFGGTGLGLAISKSLVERMGGEIGVASTEGLGSSFWFTLALPVLAANAEPVDSVQAVVASNETARVLLVEDVIVNQDLARLILEAGGHRVDVASDGLEAIEKVRRGSFDIVLMDVQMPGMDGLTATRHIRALEGACRSIPIVAMTANVLPQQIAAFKAAGMDAHLGKPFKRAELYAVIARWTKKDPGTPRMPAPPQVAVDRTVLDELRAMVGDAVCDTLLSKFAAEVDQRLKNMRESPDRASLAADAHALISPAGSLGFVGFSSLCRNLESVARKGGDLDICITAMATARGLVLNEIAGLLSDARAHMPPGSDARIANCA